MDKGHTAGDMKEMIDKTIKFEPGQDIAKDVKKMIDILRRTDRVRIGPKVKVRHQSKKKIRNHRHKGNKLR